MLKILKLGRKSYRRLFQETVVSRRTFLSEAYRCTEAWQARLQTPLIQNIKFHNFLIEVDQRRSTSGKISAIDIDILANSVQDQNWLEDLLTAVYNLRLSEETSNTLDSTHHAIIRYLLDNDCTEELITVLHDRFNYGIFPDYLCYNILMDTYIKRKDYASAAKIAVLPMLQEDDSHPITNALCVYSCHKYLENPDVWVKPQPVEDTGEEVKIRVKYIQNEYFDDHFDLTDPRDLVGKTLAFYGKLMNNTLGRTCQLRGLILYKKYEQISDIIEQWLKDVKDDVVYEEVFDLIQKDNEKVSKEEIENIMSQVDKLKTQKLCKNSLIEAIENEVKYAVNKQENVDIDEQLKTYIGWGEKRKEIFEKQILTREQLSKLQNIQEIKKQLLERERVLTFFDEEEKINMQVESIEAKEKEEMEILLSKPRMAYKLKKLKKEEVYTPPTIGN